MSMMNGSMAIALRAALFCSAMSIGCSNAQAQSASSTPSDNQNDSSIQEIVVTARFRQENLQDTPLSISAFNAKTIQNSVVTDVASVQKFLPNIQLARVPFAGNSLAASIRGISFADLEKTFDPAVGVAIDGVFLGTSTGGNIDFNDIESVEVLRGPQGTLYGRNTVGGVINVRRTKPTGELGAKLHTRYASFNTFDIDAVVNLPKIGDALSVKIFGLRRTSDSFTRNRYTNKHEPGRDYYNIGVSVLAEVGADTTVQASVDYQRDRSSYPSSVNLTKANGLVFGAGGTICDFTLAIGLGDLGCDTQGYILQKSEGFRIANTSIPFNSYIDGWNASLEFNSKIGNLNLTAITGFRDTSDSLLEENTGTPPVPVAPGVSIPLFVAARDQDYKQFSQEIRIQGDITDWMDLVAGVYYLHTNYAIRPLPYNGANIGSAFILNTPIQSLSATQILDSYAVFAESILKLTSNVRLTIGGRYTSEKKKFSINYPLPQAAAFTASAQATFSDPTGRVILDWKPNDSTMVYASWSRGFRSGGFNGRATTTTSVGPYDPERVDSYEVGLKADLADGLVRFNPTIFQANYDNKQEEFLRAAAGGATETVVQNAASARIRGIELEFQARPTRDLTLRAAGGYLDAEYRSFLLPDLTQPGNPLIDVAASRNFRRAPKYTFNGGVDYVKEISNGNSLSITVDYAYIDDIFVSAISDSTGAKRDIIQGRSTVDASIAFVHSGDSIKNLRVSGYVRDLFHKGGRLSSTLDAGVFYFGIAVPNREFGVEATVKF
jgi:iron complex outermembrane recepter protein